MSGIVNSRIKFKRDNTANWNAARGFIPLEGEIIIYNDYDTDTFEENGQTKTVVIPGVKIGDGLTYVQDLPFITDKLRRIIIDHIENPNIHVTAAEKMFWSNKINVDDLAEVIRGALTFNRN